MRISTQKTTLFFRLSISITVFGALFKFISWPLILIGAVGMIVFHSIELFQKQNRSPLDYSRQFLITAFLCNGLFSIFQLPYTDILTILTKTALIIFLVVYIKKILTAMNRGTENSDLSAYLGTEKLSYLLADLATVYIVIASLFKILNLEFGIINSDLLLVIGLFTALISILAGSKDFAK